jgi:hypothetical protein
MDRHDPMSSSSSPPYLLIAQTQSNDGNLQRPRPAYALAQANATSSPPTAQAPGTLIAPVFKAPAHKHAHHLHSIPPREKSTRTLIIDHLLTVHARARFAQARAELGMSDATRTRNAFGRRADRHETYDEQDDVQSDGESAEVLSGHLSANPAFVQGEDARVRSSDLTQASIHRSRAESLEKVVTSMLEQPPEVRVSSEGEPSAPMSPPQQPGQTNTRNPLLSHPHTLPDGVRVRVFLLHLPHRDGA